MCFKRWLLTSVFDKTAVSLESVKMIVVDHRGTKCKSDDRDVRN